MTNSLTITDSSQPPSPFVFSRAQWLGYAGGLSGRALYFRQEFSVPSSVRKSTLRIAGLGYFEPHLNGSKLGDAVLDPAPSDVSKRVFYRTFDVTQNLMIGGNAVGVIVGHGWYGMPKLILQLDIELKNGEKQTVSTNSFPEHRNWRVSAGPILADSIYDGEIYDARRELTGWDTPGFNDTDWRQAMTIEPPGGMLEEQPCEPIRVIETIVPEKKGSVYDVGKNITGWARIFVQGDAGKTITLRFAENIDDNGNLHPGTNRNADVHDIYICKGDGIEEWEPRFTYHGFRYISAEGLSEKDRLEVRIVRTDAAVTGSFSCSNDLLNRITAAIRLTEAGNLHGIPTDCPQRDERFGWLNDMTARAEATMYNFDMSRFYPKWMNDIADTQDPHTGAIADTAPFRWGSRPADPVASCYLLIPWLLYLFYNDTDTMARHYTGMKAWVDYLTSRAKHHIVEYSYYGDWAPPVGEASADSIGDGAVSAGTPGALISTANYAWTCRLLSKMSRILGHGDTDRYADLEQKIIAAYNDRFWDASAGGYGSNNQACNAISLALNLVPESRIKKTVSSLLADIEAYDFHLTTGNQCTKFMLDALSDHGHIDTAFKIVNQTTYPSWGYMLENGATTIWERWEFVKEGGMHSHNHPMLGSIGAWFYSRLAGIRPDENNPGTLNVDPQLPTGLNHLKAGFRTPTQRISVEAQREANSVKVILS